MKSQPKQKRGSKSCVSLCTQCDSTVKILRGHLISLKLYCQSSWTPFLFLFLFCTSPLLSTFGVSPSQEGGCEGSRLWEGSSNGGRAQSCQRTSYSAARGPDDPVQRNAAGERGNADFMQKFLHILTHRLPIFCLSTFRQLGRLKIYRKTYAFFLKILVCIVNYALVT